MKFSLDGTSFEIDIDKYRPSTKEQRSEDFLKISISIQSTHMSYYEDSRILRCYELDELYSRLVKLIDGKLKRNEHLFFSEPVIEFRLRPATKDGEADIDMYVIVNLRDDNGIVTANSLSLLMGRDDVEKFCWFLKSVIKPGPDFMKDKEDAEEKTAEEIKEESGNTVK